MLIKNYCIDYHRNKIIFDWFCQMYCFLLYHCRINSNNLKLAKMKTFEIGNEVKRLDGGYTVGRIGTIIEIDNENNRARVEWKVSTKTWVKFSSITLNK